MNESGIEARRQGPVQKLYCPDCGEWIKEPEFVTHREQQHPPKSLTLAVDGIQSQAAFGTDPKE